MSSFKQIEANRRNARKSTGPITQEGKRRSRCNAVRHGLTAETVIGALEDAEDYQTFEAAIIADYDAQSAVERELIAALKGSCCRVGALFSGSSKQGMLWPDTAGSCPKSGGRSGYGATTFAEENMNHRINRRSVNAGIGAALISPALGSPAAFAQGGEPIKIGFSMAQTGALAGAGQQALLGAQIWEQEINAKGGLLGRPVKLIYYDDQTNPSTVPGIYTKLLDVDKVDLIIGPYGTNMVAPALPAIMGKGKVFIGLFALDANHDFHYPKYFSMLPSGPTPKQSFTEGFFEVAAAQNPKPQTVAITAEDAEFSRNAADGARENVHKYGFKVVYDRTYPPNTTDFSPIIRAIQATNPDLVVICSYPNTSVGMVQSASELGLKPKMMGGGMVGIQYTAIKSKLKSRLNGIVNYEFWVPTPKLVAPAADFFKKYQAQAPSRGVDPLGYYLGGWGYAYFEVLQQAVEATKSLNDDKLADYMRTHSFTTITNPDIKFGKDGEWTKSGVMQVQYHDITDSANLDTWRGMSYQTVLTPADQKTGDVIYPYEKATG